MQRFGFLQSWGWGNARHSLSADLSRKEQLYLSAVKIRVESRRERIVEGPFSSASAAGLQDLGGLFSCVPFFSVFRSVRLLGVRGSAESMESLWTILIRAISRFRVRGLD